MALSSSARGSMSTAATTFDDDDTPAKSKITSSPPHDMSSSTSSGSSAKESKGNVIVSVRVRPDANKTDNGRAESDWYVDGRQSVVSYRGKDGGDYYYGEYWSWHAATLAYPPANPSFNLPTDNVFSTSDDNARVYDAAAKRLVRRVMEGYHGTVFAYGMTGTGKTFSMQGTASSPGVIPLAITDIFSYIRETPHREFLLRVSYLEIYNEKIHDLLAPQNPGNGLGPQAPQEEIKLREDSKRGVYATPLKEEIVQSPTQLLRVIARGDQNRRVAGTQFNARSSRSHAVVQIVVESRERAGANAGDDAAERPSAIAPGGVRVSTLSLIDLAGSERAAETKERRTEGAHINKSLLTLGNVISRLSELKDKAGNPTDRDGRHLPYRDSKLTRLLQPALSGNSLVSILCTIQTGSGNGNTPAATHILETLNTLKFASRAKNNIVSNARKAEETLGQGAGDAGSRALLERYRLEIAQLKEQLDTQAKLFAERENQFDELEERLLAKESERATDARHEEQLLEMQLARTALKERIEHLNRLILSSQSNGVNMGGSYGQPTPVQSEPTLRSTRSSTSTLGQPGQAMSVLSNLRSTPMMIDEDDTIGQFADGYASLQLQVDALHADLADKSRYIATLERRLMQARRSSHTRVSAGYSHRRQGSKDENTADALLLEKDMEISELRTQLDDKDRMLAALRSATRQRDIAYQTAAEPFIGGDGKRKSTASYGGSTVMPMSPVSYISSSSAPVRQSMIRDDLHKRQSVESVSKMLDEMIEERVDSVLIESRLATTRVEEDAPHRPISLIAGRGRGSSVAAARSRTSSAAASGNRASERGSQPPSSTAIPISSILRKPPARRSTGPADAEAAGVPAIRPLKSMSRRSFTSESDASFILKPSPPVPPLDTEHFDLPNTRPSPLLVAPRSVPSEVNVTSG
ncbi:hypothetical protein KEM52_005709 [Ascosphaera acerosa]|nr:hypothetical protein KEM52_005709 [Ascosphaera acerosa]